eukprot:TRINITY_DN111623_c0_g1_i1.p1 TRINITY_DN111623_c0_g1~~TRINITY_DN111623_c0_g1_i1.p1  ORF type:complete len:340 (-),score=62.37 TRINITY_DN111623_c0_g1_i1:304-1323(-)
MDRSSKLRWILAASACLVTRSSATVCDDASAKHVSCIELAGGVKMPMVALGTWRGSYKDCKGDNFTCAQNHALEAVETWVGKLGATHVDTANNYRTQVQVGEALKATGVSRSEVFVTTKCPGTIGYNATLQCAEDNLQMLGFYGSNGRGYIDLLLVHFPFVIKPECNGAPLDAPGCSPPFYNPGKEQLQETWKAMEFLKRSGRVRAIGVSDYEIEHLQQTLEIATLPISVNQVEWHPYKHDEKLKAFCSKHGIATMAWSPLSGQKASALSDPEVKSIADRHKVSPAQVVLRWSLQQNVSVVTGTAKPEHMKGDLDIFSFQLTAEEMASISGLKSQEIMV